MSKSSDEHLRQMNERMLSGHFNVEYWTEQQRLADEYQGQQAAAEHDSQALTPGEQAMLNQIDALIGEELSPARKRELALHLARNQATVERLLIEMLVRTLDLLAFRARKERNRLNLNGLDTEHAETALDAAKEAGYKI